MAQARSMSLTVQGRLLDVSFWQRPTVDVARAVLGKVLISDLGGARTAGRVVETEAYLRDDPASHSFRGRTARNSAMFGPPGTAYVYFTYGNHWCLNFVTAEEGVGEAVLVRALQPLEGMQEMALRRGRDAARDLLSGPGKICQAIAVTRDLNFHPLDAPPLWLVDDGWEAGAIVARPRVGISRFADRLWRFYPAECAKWVSRR